MCGLSDCCQCGERKRSVESHSSTSGMTWGMYVGELGPSNAKNIIGSTVLICWDDILNGSKIVKFEFKIFRLRHSHQRSFETGPLCSIAHRVAKHPIDAELRLITAYGIAYLFCLRRHAPVQQKHLEHASMHLKNARILQILQRFRRFSAHHSIFSQLLIANFQNVFVGNFFQCVLHQRDVRGEEEHVDFDDQR